MTKRSKDTTLNTKRFNAKSETQSSIGKEPTEETQEPKPTPNGSKPTPSWPNAQNIQYKHKSNPKPLPPHRTSKETSAANRNWNPGNKPLLLPQRLARPSLHCNHLCTAGQQTNTINQGSAIQYQHLYISRIHRPNVHSMSKSTKQSQKPTTTDDHPQQPLTSHTTPSAPIAAPITTTNKPTYQTCPA